MSKLKKTLKEVDESIRRALAILHEPSRDRMYEYYKAKRDALAMTIGKARRTITND